MSNELLHHIDRLIQNRPMYKEALSVYRDIVIFLNKAKPEIKYAVKDDVISRVKVKEGFPLFSRENLPLDLKVTSSLFEHLLEHVSSKKRRDKEALKKALYKARAQYGWLMNLIAAFLSGDEEAMDRMAKEVDLEPMVLKFLTHTALKPSLNELKIAAGKKIVQNGWNYGYCPLCGSYPDMAYLGNEGKRFLHCELCGFEWHYPRLQCPFCKNDQPEELGYFVSEEEEGFRVDFCKKCKRYIKTLDMRVIEQPAPLDLENLVTLHLDLLAHDQGYKAHESI